MTQGSQQELARQKNKKRQSSSVKGMHYLLGRLFPKQRDMQIMQQNCAPPLCRRWSDRWGRNALTEGDAALKVAEDQSRRNVPYLADLRLLQGRMTLSRVSEPSDIIYSLWSNHF
uniref:Uncharacterized protein n=1 Tax=Bos indicus x Bos taurus TaxID=30522 RepID=A0A4W2DTZ6_BOBOX